MTCEVTPRSPQDVVVLQYTALLQTADNAPGAGGERSVLERQIEQAYGPDGLGLLTVAGVPGFVELRQRLLPLAQAFAALPESTKSLYADPTSLYNFGWSHGVEMLSNGKPDRHKGSYYANPVTDVPTNDEALMKKYPAYCRPNIWPTEHLPEYETAFKELGRLICQVGMLVTKACDQYVAARNPKFPTGRLLQSIQNSSCHKGRLLHYFPPEPTQLNGMSSTTSHHQNGNATADAPDSLAIDGHQANGNATADAPDSLAINGHQANGKQDKDSSSDSKEEEDWCGWHTDHGSLTGLTSAMYMKGDQPVPNPDAQAGLYVRGRQGSEITQAPIPPNHIAFQMGEAMQVLSGGLLRATPHYVRAPRKDRTQGVSRNTLAVFMQPRWDEAMDLPQGGLPQEQVGVGQWQPGIGFGQFAERTVAGFYHAKN